MKNLNKEKVSNPGFRLQRFEVLNWGTFNRNVWSINPNGENSLLTGDIGTGKSTLVDAITTLLVPAGRIIYNKAAGAEGKERSLSDYILGLFKKEKDTSELQAKAVSLRKRKNAFTILLGIFYDANFKETVCLAQFFWIKEGKSHPERFFLVSSSPLSIEKDLYIVNSDVLSLKKKLKTLPNIKIFDTYTSYSAEFRRRMAIQSNQALELFYQTVSMKSIGNLTEFVRSHMLEDTPIKDQVDDLCRNFENLNRAHDAVLRARDQIELLTPMILDCDEYNKGESDIVKWKDARESLYSYMASIEKNLCKFRLERLGIEINKIDGKLSKNEKKTKDLELIREKIRKDIDDNGGRRLAELETLIQELGDEMKRIKDKSIFYKTLGEKIGIEVPSDDNLFYENLSLAEKKITELENLQSVKNKEETDLVVILREHDKEYKSIEKELNSLKNRPTNIPYTNLELRKRLCQELNLLEKDIPFAGELIEVKEEESSWTGALERLLHNFALSLLVEDLYYDRVSNYVDSTNLRGRIVYYRIKDQKDNLLTSPNSNQVITKLRIKADTSFYHWLENEITKRYDYICCDSLKDFKHQPRALTSSGQIKSGGVRHEKDDRYNINDKTRYILGWKNKQKIALLEKELDRIKTLGNNILIDVEMLSKEIKELGEKRDAARDLIAIQDFREIDWQSVSLRIEEYGRELNEIKESDNLLQTLKEQLDKVEKDITEFRGKREDFFVKRGEINKEIETLKESLKKSEIIFLSVDEEKKNRTFSLIETVVVKLVDNKKFTLKNINDWQKKIRENIQKNIENLTDQNRRRDSKISSQMQSFKDKYPVETSEIDGNIESADEFRTILDELINQDLPRHEDRFKRLLREETIQDIALFQNHLERDAHEIKEKILIINNSLKEIEYDRGSYITLLPDRTVDLEIRHFQEDLKNCMGDTLGNEGDDVYSENKFKQVKELIDRFQGRVGFSEIDKKWTDKVTDVRNWFLFSASERWIDDDAEKEFYSDSSGKSGGQKEKLAYTILAAALAYQFSLVKDGLWIRSFRFVMIDEAFGRGSDESARYGLELFKKLNLQILIVTPLQKIHVIEDFIKAVHFVYQENNQSLLGQMTIEEFKNKKAQKQKLENLDDISGRD